MSSIIIVDLFLSPSAQEFMEALSAFPTQILRYSWSGSPLLMSPLTTTSNMVCLNCGAGKVSEMQLLPTLLNFLKCDTGSEDRVGFGREGALIDFGTVLVFSCSKSCWSEREPKLMTETVILQTEPGKEFSQRGM